MKRIDREILRLALPSIVSNITVPLLGLCDVTIMGHVGGATNIAAIAVGSMIFNVMYWLFVFLRMSTSGLTAQAYGAARWDLTRATLRRGMTMALGFGLAIVVLQVPLRSLTFWLMQASGEVERLCTPYYYICIWGAPAVLGLYVLTGWLIGMQNTRVPMMISIGQNVINIAVSLILVIGFGMGIKGVALGTLIAQWAGFLIGLMLIPKSLTPDPSRGGEGSDYLVAETDENTGKEVTTPLSPARGVGGEAGGAGGEASLFLRTVCLVSVNLYFTSAGSAQGAVILAANTLLIQFFTIYSYVMDGFAFAGEALSGRYLGAGDNDMLRQTVLRLFGWGTVVAFVFTLFYWLGGPLLLRLLTTDAKVVLTAIIYLPWAVLIPVAGLAAFVWDGIFIGTTLSRGMLMSAFIAAISFFTLCFVLSPTMGNHALWLALLVYLFMRGAIQTMLWKNRK
ncbi:MAG: MATE family efflux transporter [Prevotella sp.]|nr:MATE family efflux transporter [Prevotella sp.]